MKKYKIVYQENGNLKSKTIETNNLELEELPSNIIEIKKSIFEFKFQEKITDNQIRNSLYELSMMLNSKILLDDAFDILIKNEKKQHINDFLKSLKNSFSNSSDIYTSIDRFKINPLIKSMFKIIQDSGNTKENLSFLSDIISENIQIKKDFKKAMTYPFILLITFFSALIGIFKFVVPNFESIFNNAKGQLPLATRSLLFVKEIFENYLFLIVFILIAFVVSIFLFYKKEKRVRVFIDKIIVENLYIISSLYKYKNLYTFFVVLDILLKSKYEFLDAFIKAKTLINNQHLFDKITKIENLLKSGKSVKLAFESSNLFDDIILNLINSAEASSSLEIVVSEIKIIYKRRFEDKLKFFSTLIEPLFFIIIMALIVWIILAIFVPLWSMSDMLKS